jgi:hypothetical protein
MRRSVAARGFLPALAAIVLIGCGGPSYGPRTEPAPVGSEDVRNDVVPWPLTAAELAEMLTTGSGEDALVATVFDAGSVVLEGGGQKLLVFLEDDGQSLQAVLPYIGRGRGEAGPVARWNAGRRFGRAYRDDAGGPVLAADLLLAPGLPVAVVRTWGRLLVGMAAAFRDEVWPSAAPPVAPHDE